MVTITRRRLCASIRVVWIKKKKKNVRGFNLDTEKTKTKNSYFTLTTTVIGRVSHSDRVDPWIIILVHTRPINFREGSM